MEKYRSDHLQLPTKMLQCCSFSTLSLIHYITTSPPQQTTYGKKHYNNFQHFKAHTKVFRLIKDKNKKTPKRAVCLKSDEASKETSMGGPVCL